MRVANGVAEGIERDGTAKVVILRPERKPCPRRVSSRSRVPGVRWHPFAGEGTVGRDRLAQLFSRISLALEDLEEP
jgi:hypothetical protein